MAEVRNLCAPIPAELHARVRKEQEKAGLTLGAYMTEVLTNYFEGGGAKTMTGTMRTMAFQMQEDLFQRLKNHLAAESARTGKKLSQKDFVLGLIQQALDEAETRNHAGMEDTGAAPEPSEDAGEG